MVVFMVVRCCSCEIFQVQQTKKTNKWTCKVCNSKQSLCKVYGEGAAADCRKHVQKLNLMQAEQDQQVMSAALAMPADIYDTSFQGNESPDSTGSNSHRPVFVSGTKNRWSAFVEPHDVEEEESEGVWFSEWTTNKEEFEKGMKKIRRERRNVKNGEESRTRMSGFHPVSQPPANAVTTTLNPTPSSSSASTSTPVFPYTSLGAGIAQLLYKPPDTPLTASRSSHCLDEPIHGTYRKLDRSGDTREKRERPLSSSHSAHNLIGKIAQSSGKHDLSRQNNSDSTVGQSFSVLKEKEVVEEVKGSKWSQFITVSEEEEEEETSELV